MNIEKTCENCEYEHEGQFGPHCRNCIHNASEQFIPKAKYTERARIVDAFAEKLADVCSINTFQIELGGLPVDVMTIDNITELIFDVAEEVKGKYSTSDLVDDLANAFAKAERG